MYLDNSDPSLVVKQMLIEINDSINFQALIMNHNYYCIHFMNHELLCFYFPFFFYSNNLTLNLNFLCIHSFKCYNYVWVMIYLISC
jgi:hypothetical protein